MKYFWFLAALIFSPAYAMEVPQECQAITRHVPGAGVAYQPGVDVHGRPVVPADLGAPSPFGVPDVMVVPLSVDIAARLNKPVEGLVGEAPLGFLEIYPDGRMVYEGKEVARQAITLCQQDWSAIEPLPPQAKADQYGQAEDDPIQSEPVPVAVPPAPEAAPAVPSGELIEGGESRDNLSE